MCLPACGGHLQQQRARAAGRVVGGGGRLRVLRRDADHLGDDAADLGGGVELPLALAALGGEVPHQVLVGVAEDVVVLGAVLREVELRASAKMLIRLVSRSTMACPSPSLLESLKSGKSLRASRALASTSGAMTCVLILSPMSLLPREREHVLEARALGDRDRRGEVVAVAVLVGDVLDEQHEQDVVLVLAGIHAAAQLVARGPERGVEVGFLDGHGSGASLRDLAGIDGADRKIHAREAPGGLVRLLAVYRDVGLSFGTALASVALALACARMSSTDCTNMPESHSRDHTASDAFFGLACVPPVFYGYPSLASHLIPYPL